MAMSDNDLVCNFRKCRKRLVDVAWVTSCSHTFCDEDGTREFSKGFVCPACDHSLCGKQDIVRQDLQPNEQWKSMILAALKPEVIMEIASRAITFWTYQSHQEKIYHQYSLEKSKDSRDKLEHYYEQLVSKLQVEIKSAKIDIHAKAKELNETRKRYNELTEQHQEKSRQHQKLQIMYDTLRRKSINPAAMGDGNSGSKPNSNKIDKDQFKTSHQFQMALGSNILGSSRNIRTLCEHDQPLLLQGDRPANFKSPTANPGHGWVLKPYPTPVQALLEEDDIGHSIGQQFKLHLSTPKK